MMRFGLCCIFHEQPIKFHTTTVAAIGKMERKEALLKLSHLCLENANSLLKALKFCRSNYIGCFRVNSRILPIKTHLVHGYNIEDLPEAQEIVSAFKLCGEFSKANNIRTCFHPDQFVVLNSPKSEVVESSIRELEYQAEVAEWIGADVINIHGGGAYNDKPKALNDLIANFDRLSERVKSRLTIENDDKTYTPTDLLPICNKLNIPFLYDVHHHRCNPDDLTIEEATKLAIDSWNREPMFHISSPINGWNGSNTNSHHDYIDLQDFPELWRTYIYNDLNVTVEVEAKAKELAVIKLMKRLTDEETLKILLNSITFGIRHYVGKIEEMLKNGENWDAIGKAINWCPITAQEYYERITNK